MKRLVEQTHPAGTLESRAAALLSAAGPSAPDPALKRRVRENLLRVPLAEPSLLARLLGSSPRRRAPRARRVRILAFALVAGIGCASAAAASWYLWSEPRVAPASAAPLLPDSARQELLAPPRHEPPAPLEFERVISALSPEAHVETVKSDAAPSAVVAEPSEESMLFDATRALRHEGNPGKASRLLTDYQRRFPAGALAEEALALSVEVAQRRGDPRAKELAQRYLERYPSGHFRARAERVLENANARPAPSGTSAQGAP